MVTHTLTSAPVELDRWRRDTPGCRDRIHLNNAGAGLMPRPVLDALMQHLAREAAIGGYEAADEAEPRVREPYALVAQLGGARPGIHAPGWSPCRGCRPIRGWCRMHVPLARSVPSWVCRTWSTPARR